MSISGISSGASQFASALFSKIDTRQQGYISEDDLTTAFSMVDKARGKSSNIDAAEVFKQFDSDSDGKVTKDEFSSAIENLASQLDQQLMSSRMGGPGGPGAAGGMPPPPPKDDTGFTKDQLSSQIEEIGSKDSKRTDLLNKIVNNFDDADSDGDGKVSFKEAMAYDKSTQASDSGTTSDTSNTNAQANSEAQLMMKILQLAHAYGTFGTDQNSAGVASLLSTQA
ncbi:EF-hand domain-containing protein [Niveibacterium microcysteis]|uniref:EF-hand domain-containing protein n=1 Tax=Niveibacterium microcysteis TaxID=2811415 RepID=A0ABX7MBT6_9RHOO|nr:EF-hand domain-containing protein [Niveibacterium microcysteis]QSI78094.1 EF-hand domain-containing protein [Niveibacterium microcysteis]